MFLALGVVAAIGRVLQLGGAGELGRGSQFALELVVEGARIAWVLYLLGSGSFAAGITGLRRTLIPPAPWLTGLEAGFRLRWRGVAVSFVAFLAIAAAANVAIFFLARHSPLLAVLQRAGLMAWEAGPQVVVLFLKNLSVIPWTLAFWIATGRWLLASQAR